MSDNTSITFDSTGSTITTTNPNAELRAYADRLKDEVEELRSEMLALRLDSIGLKTDTGLGKAIFKEYDGALDEASVSAYAKTEYGYEADEPKVDPAIVNEGTKRAEQIMGESIPVTPEQKVDPMAEADKKLASEDATPRDAQMSIEQKLRALQGQ